MNVGDKIIVLDYNGEPSHEATVVGFVDGADLLRVKRGDYGTVEYVTSKRAVPLTLAATWRNKKKREDAGCTAMVVFVVAVLATAVLLFTVLLLQVRDIEKRLDAADIPRVAAERKVGGP